MKRIRTKPGDVFSVKIDENSKKYFQYISNDLTQLNSPVIRAFKKIYPLDTPVDLPDIILDEVDFYAHVVLRWGIEQNLWEKVGNIDNVGKLDILFRDTNDYGSKPGEQIEVTSNWYVWKINGLFKKNRLFRKKYKSAEIGIVVTPIDIVERLKTGRYSFFYPKFE